MRMTLSRCSRSSRKCPELDPRLQVLVGGGDDAHVDLHRRLPADAIELALRQHAQQPRLQRRRHVADFIEKQSAAVGLLEAAAAQRVGAGESALLVAEQFGLQQVRREGGGVERDEGLAGARAVPMQGARHQFLAGAGFAGDQHRHAGARQSADGAKHLLHGRRLAEQFRNAAARGFDIGGHRGLLGGAAHQIHRLVDVEGLGQVFERAALIGGDRRVQIRMRGHHDDRQAGPRHLNFLQQFEPAASGHANVGHQHVGSIGAQRRQHIVGLVETLGGHAAALQRLLEHPTNRGVVVDQPHLQGLCIHTGVHRQRNHEYGSARRAVEFDQAAVAADEILGDTEPKPVPSARPDTSG